MKFLSISLLSAFWFSSASLISSILHTMFNLYFRPLCFYRPPRYTFVLTSIIIQHTGTLSSSVDICSYNIQVYIVKQLACFGKQNKTTNKLSIESITFWLKHFEIPNLRQVKWIQNSKSKYVQVFSYTSSKLCFTFKASFSLRVKPNVN